MKRSVHTGSGTWGRSNRSSRITNAGYYVGFGDISAVREYRMFVKGRGTSELGSDALSWLPMAIARARRAHPGVEKCGLLPISEERWGKKAEHRLQS